ncbi:MAG: F0F1 ATP synthase subunit delta [Candidatus Omnitrophota bacterium]
MNVQLMVGFVMSQVVVFGAILGLLYYFYVSQTDGAKKRLERDAEAARVREVELNRKISAADDELVSRRKELDKIELKMKTELEAEATKHKEELVQKARAEAEEIITRAQNSAAGIRRDIEKQMELKIIDHSVNILNGVLARGARVSLEKDLVEEFIEQLKAVDMSKISLDIKEADVITSADLGPSELKRITDIIKNKSGRDIILHAKIDGSQVVAGMVIHFGSLQLDGSFKAAVRDAAVALKAEVEKASRKQ